MKKLFLASTFSLSLCCIPMTIDAETLPNNTVATIPTTHTFTVTFNEDVTTNQHLINSMTVLLNNEAIPVTTATSGTKVTLDPVNDLQPNTTYEVNVELTNGASYTRTFTTTVTLNTATEQQAYTTFTAKYPQYAQATMMTTMQEQLQLVENGQADAATTAAVKAIPSQIKLLDQLLQQAATLKATATTVVNNATTNDFELSMQLDALSSMIDEHMLSAPSFEVLLKLKDTWQNVASLMDATAKANSAGIALIPALEETNEMLAQFIMTTPFLSAVDKAAVVKSLKSSFTTNLTHVTATESKVQSQLKTMEHILSNAEDYLFALEEAAAAVADIDTYKQTYATWGASSITSITTPYKEFDQAKSSISSRIESSTSPTSLESTISDALEKADNAEYKLIDAIDAYLDKELTTLTSAFEDIEENATSKELDYYSLDSYQAAYDALLNYEAQYSYYDEDIDFNHLKQAISSVNATFNTLKNDIKGFKRVD